MNVMGIDPGLSGALAVIDADGPYVAHLLMPTIKLGKRNRVNGAAVAEFVRDQSPDAVFLERVSSMPGQGVASCFSFGHSAGIVEGVTTALGIPLTLVTPQAWKKGAGLIGSEKDAARARAVQLYPTVSDLALKSKGQAIADALLIARHGLNMGQ